MLTAKQQRFTEEYVVDYNGTQAYIRAGYAKTGAAQSASVLLRNPKIQEAIGESREKAANQTQLTHQYVLKGLMEIAESQNPTMTQSARVRAYELLGKHQGMFTDRLEITQMPSRELVDEWITALADDLADG